MVAYNCRDLSPTSPHRRLHGSVVRLLLRSRGTYIFVERLPLLSSTPTFCASRLLSFPHTPTRPVSIPLDFMSGHPSAASLQNDILACLAALRDDFSQSIARVGEENRAVADFDREVARVAYEILREEIRAT
jgi:hypothetical protein